MLDSERFFGGRLFRRDSPTGQFKKLTYSPAWQIGIYNIRFRNDLYAFGSPSEWGPPEYYISAESFGANYVQARVSFVNAYGVTVSSGGNAGRTINYANSFVDNTRLIANTVGWGAGVEYPLYPEYPSGAVLSGTTVSAGLWVGQSMNYMIDTGERALFDLFFFLPGQSYPAGWNMESIIPASLHDISLGEKFMIRRHVAMSLMNSRDFDTITQDYGMYRTNKSGFTYFYPIGSDDLVRRNWPVM